RDLLQVRRDLIEAEARAAVLGQAEDRDQVGVVDAEDLALAGYVRVGDQVEPPADGLDALSAVARGLAAAERHERVAGECVERLEAPVGADGDAPRRLEVDAGQGLGPPEQRRERRKSYRDHQPRQDPLEAVHRTTLLADAAKRMPKCV